MHILCIFDVMEGKRIVFSTASPNDQGGVIPNNSIDFARFKKNPVVLCQHDWNAPPLGKMTDIREENGQWTGVPVFHRITDSSREYADMYEAGHIQACSIGGEAEWKTNNAGQVSYDKGGNRICERFNLYEISIVTLPSNADAVQLEAKIYDKSELQSINDNIVKLSSQYNLTPMSKPNENGTEPKKPTVAELKAQLAAAEAEEREAARLSAIGGGLSNSDPSVNQNPEVIRALITNNAETSRGQLNLLGRFLDFMFGEKTGKNLNNLTPPAQTGQPESKIVDPEMDQPEPTGMSAEQKDAKEKAAKALNSAISAADKARLAKAKAEAANASKADVDAYNAAYTASQVAFEAALSAEDEYKACMENAEEPEDGEDGKPKKTKAKNAAKGGKTTLGAGQSTDGPVIKTVEQLKAEQTKLAPKPEFNMKFKSLGRTTFSALAAKDNAEGDRILNRVLGSGADGEKDISDYMVVAAAIANDKKFAPLVEKFRLFSNISSGQFSDMRRTGRGRNDAGGTSFAGLCAELASGSVNVLDRSNTMHQMTSLSAAREMVKLDSSDNALAAPALNAIEWLAMAIFALYPTSDWKSDIPMFSAEMTGKNLGLIWPNIVSDPEIFFGDKPANPADYDEPDQAVSVTLASTWLQPMIWTPHDLHTLRYDKMATNWAQAFAKWGSIIDDFLLYTFGSTVPLASVIQTIGQKGQFGPGPSFTLTGVNDPNNFYYNPTLQTTLATPAWADITRIEQLWNRQNFQINNEKSRLIIDPTMEAFIGLDPDTKSLLTRFTESDGTDLLKIKHTKLNQRSRVIIWDPATNQVKDPTGAIPATAVSAALAFIASQLALAIGMMDVFMIQDPSAYAYRMSANTRQGGVPIHYTFRGTGLYTYGQPVNP